MEAVLNRTALSNFLSAEGPATSAKVSIESGGRAGELGRDE